jgi:hypothetical protein
MIKTIKWRVRERDGAKAKKAVVEESPKSRREDVAVSSREGSDEDARLLWKGWRSDVAWLSRTLEPALRLYKQYCSTIGNLSDVRLQLHLHLYFILLLILLRNLILPCSSSWKKRVNFPPLNSV